MFEGNVELGCVSELEREHFLQPATSRGCFRELNETADAVLEMNDEIAFRELTEINLRAVAGKRFPALQTPPPVRRCPTEQLRGRQDHERTSGETEAAGERSFGQSNTVEGAIRARHDLAETFDLTFRLKVDYDTGAPGFPLLETNSELRAFRLRDQEVAHRELANLRVVKRSRVVFLRQI